MKNKKQPLAKSAKEEAAYWETHSVADHVNQLEKVDDLFVLSSGLAHKIRDRAKKRLVSIRLAQWEIDQSKQIAKKKKVPYQVLIRTWIDLGLRSEFTGTAYREAA